MHLWYYALSVQVKIPFSDVMNCEVLPHPNGFVTRISVSGDPEDSLQFVFKEENVAQELLHKISTPDLCTSSYSDCSSNTDLYADPGDLQVQVYCGNRGHVVAEYNESERVEEDSGSEAAKIYEVMSEVAHSKEKLLSVGAKVFAQFDHSAESDSELSVHEGDEIEVLEERVFEGWFRGRMISTRKCGLVPSNYVADYETILSHVSKRQRSLLFKMQAHVQLSEEPSNSQTPSESTLEKDIAAFSRKIASEEKELSLLNHDLKHCQQLTLLAEIRKSAHEKQRKNIEREIEWYEKIRSCNQDLASKACAMIEKRTAEKSVLSSIHHLNEQYEIGLLYSIDAERETTNCAQKLVVECMLADFENFLSSTDEKFCNYKRELDEMLKKLQKKKKKLQECCIVPGCNDLEESLQKAKEEKEKLRRENAEIAAQKKEAEQDVAKLEKIKPRTPEEIVKKAITACKRDIQQLRKRLNAFDRDQLHA
ncbi:chromosome partition protein Smc-like isoform X2 [Oscarella lobularis]|uniref:chromosome partition protein Smc-like isoform X2 n=1 Tax=Oscarella lobularis TaxID=121494 RepID=UPI003313A16D